MSGFMESPFQANMAGSLRSSKSLASLSSGSFSPATLYAGGVAGVWYDPSDLTTLFQDAAGTTPVTAAGQPVALMRDKSGNNRHVSNTGGITRPTLANSGSLYWLEMDAVNTYFRSASFTMINQAVTMCIGYQFNLAGETSYLFDDSDGASRFALAKLSTAQLSAFAGGQIDVQAGSTVVSVVDGVYNGASSTFKTNGGADITGDTGSNGQQGITIGCRFSGSNFFGGKFYGMMTVAGTSSQRAGMRAYMDKKTGRA